MFNYGIDYNNLSNLQLLIYTEWFKACCFANGSKSSFHQFQQSRNKCRLESIVWSEELDEEHVSFYKTSNNNNTFY